MMTENEKTEILQLAAVTQASAMFQALAIVAALAERRLVEPLKVAAWADVFAQNQGGNQSAAIREGIAQQLVGFASVLRSMATKPAGGGQVRQ
jgi:hypothetical protein